MGQDRNSSGLGAAKRSLQQDGGCAAPSPLPNVCSAPWFLNVQADLQQQALIGLSNAQTMHLGRANAAVLQEKSF